MNMSAPDFLAVGHVTLDRFSDGARPGGAALYAAVTAQRLGFSAGILTSHGQDFPLDAIPPQIEVVSVPAARTTVFAYADGGGRRRVPDDWLDAPLVLLSPVLAEVDPGLADVFSEATTAAAAQGWLRRPGFQGIIDSEPWAPPATLLSRLQALFVSTEDIEGQEAELHQWMQRLPVAVVTAGPAGALLYVNGDRYEVKPRRAREVDDTGAGDVFAAAFMIQYHLGGDPWEAAAAATCAASLSVEAQGWSAVPDRSRMEATLAEYLKRT
jgi:sugar/nucleoside kinase (ribokinase family)